MRQATWNPNYAWHHLHIKWDTLCSHWRTRAFDTLTCGGQNAHTLPVCWQFTVWGETDCRHFNYIWTDLNLTELTVGLSYMCATLCKRHYISLPFLMTDWSRMFIPLLLASSTACGNQATVRYNGPTSAIREPWSSQHLDQQGALCNSFLSKFQEKLKWRPNHFIA